MVAAIIFLLLSTLVFNSPTVLKGETNEASFIIKTSVTYYNNGTGNWVFKDEDRAISLFMNNTWQTVHLTYHSHPLERFDTDEDGNPIAVLKFLEAEIEPGKSISYAVTYYALSKPRFLPLNISEENSRNLDDIPEELIERYCGEGDPWLVNDQELQDLAYNIAKGETNVLTIVKKFITWIRDPDNIRYKTHETPMYPNETYTKREGDCDDQAILFVTLCRILGIPSYLQIGCIYMPTTTPTQNKYWEDHLTISLKHIGWHGWAMVYIPPWEWLPVDLTYVLDGHSDPLNAIKNAAVTSQKTLQYMNISQMDYVTSSRGCRDFFKNNGFYVYAQYEMTQTLPESLLDVIIEKLEELFPWILVTAIVVVTVVIAGISMYLRKEKKLKHSKWIIANP
ncbi:MAG: Transglutaminase-like superfamily protein [Candidatus Bathyarchaeota archaeon BA2]|nr:MAG: Transglutaminase-like superfamily protein [Candidatus Bathyarchaeota archaeon BA2]